MAATARRSLRSGPEGGAPTSLDAPGATMTRASSIRRTGHMAQPDEPVDAPSPARNASPRMPPPSAGPSHVTFTLETPEPPRPRKRQRTGEAPPVVVPDTECSFCEGNVDRNVCRSYLGRSTRLMLGPARWSSRGNDQLQPLWQLRSLLLPAYEELATRRRRQVVRLGLHGVQAV
jgi:hypothetical protein